MKVYQILIGFLLLYQVIAGDDESVINPRQSTKSLQQLQDEFKLVKSIETIKSSKRWSGLGPQIRYVQNSTITPKDSNKKFLKPTGLFVKWNVTVLQLSIFSLVGVCTLFYFGVRYAQLKQLKSQKS